MICAGEETPKLIYSCSTWDHKISLKQWAGLWLRFLNLFWSFPISSISTGWISKSNELHATLQCTFHPTTQGRCRAGAPELYLWQPPSISLVHKAPYIGSFSYSQLFTPGVYRSLLLQNQTHLWFAQPGLPCGSKQLQQVRLRARSCCHTSCPLISQAFLYQTQLVGRALNLPASCTWPIKAMYGGEKVTPHCRWGTQSASRGFLVAEPGWACFVGCRFELPLHCCLPHLEPEVKDERWKRTGEFRGLWGMLGMLTACEEDSRLGRSPTWVVTAHG